MMPSAKDLYLDLLKRCLANVIYQDPGTLDGKELHLSWTETGGPEVKPPDDRGFGTVVIERSIAHELGGSADLAFEPGGLRCDIRVPLS